MSTELPTVAKLAERLLLDIEQAVRGFARYHKYTLGTDLRAQAATLVRLMNRAWRDRARRAAWLEELAWAVDELKVSLQLGKQLQAFRSFGQFEALARLVADIGRQVGGWQRRVMEHLKGQNAAAPSSAGSQRPQILSTQATLSGVRS